MGLMDRLRGVHNAHNPATASADGNLSILDVYSAHHDHLDARSARYGVLRGPQDETMPPPHLGCAGRCLWRLRRWAIRLWRAPTQWVFLVVLGLLTAVAGFCMDGLSSWMLQTRLDYLASDGNEGFLSFMWWAIWCMLFATVAASVGHFVSPDAEGSGIPEMKSILSGTPTLSRYLSFQVMIAKVIGAVCALGGGLAVGKEGPFVHVAAILAHKMWQLPWFRHAAALGRVTRNQNLAAAVAAGVTAVFGAPVGGVLFSIEVTATYYLVGNLWRAFICSIFCVVMFELINALKEDDLFEDTSFKAVAHNGIGPELIAFSLLGVCCGFMASGIVHLVTRVLQLRKELVKSHRARYAYTLVVAFLCALLTFPATFLRKPYRVVINDMFTSGTSMGDWDEPSSFTSLLVYLVVATIITPLCLSLPIPCGLFTPLFCFGAVFGRAFGEMASAFAPSSGIVPGAYAVVGAAALTSGATQTLSTTVIVFELTGQLHHMVPVLLATVIAYSVAGSWSISIYDVLLQLKGLPYLPRAHSRGLYNKTAQDLMHRDVRYLVLNKSTYADAARLLSLIPLGGPRGQQLFEFPIVDDEHNMALVGSVLRVTLEEAISRRRHASSMRTGAQSAGMALPIGALAIRRSASTLMRRRDTNGGPRVGTASDDDITTPLTVAHDAAASVTTDVEAASDVSGDVGHGTGVGDDGSASAPGSRAAGGEESQSSSPAGDSWLNERLPMDSWAPLCIQIDRAPFQVAELTPLPKVHFLFATCQFAQVSVTLQGRLVGVILKGDLTDPHRLAIASQEAVTVVGSSPQRSPHRRPTSVRLAAEQPRVSPREESSAVSGASSAEGGTMAARAHMHGQRAGTAAGEAGPDLTYGDAAAENMNGASQM